MEFIIGAYIILIIFSLYAFKYWEMTWIDLLFYMSTLAWMHLATAGSIERWESPKFDEYFKMVTENVNGNLVAYGIGSIPIIQISVVICIGILIISAYFVFKSLFKKQGEGWIVSIIYMFVLYIFVSMFIDAIKQISVSKKLEFTISFIEEIVFLFVVIMFMFQTFPRWLFPKKKSDRSKRN